MSNLKPAPITDARRFRTQHPVSPDRRRLVAGPAARGETTFWPDGRVTVWDGTWGPDNGPQVWAKANPEGAAAFEARWAETEPK